MRKLLKIITGVVVVLITLLALLLIYVLMVARIEEPTVTDKTYLDLKREEVDTLFYKIGNNWFRKSESGLYEMYIEGDAFERGVIIGKLSEELVKKQETIFNNQIEKLVPSRIYRTFLTYFVGWFNRDLDEHVPKEYKLEILGIAQSASHEYDHIATPYQRLLNYHAAHDIGHALQNMSLVGCTSFGTWNSASKDSSLIIGRNFDFFVGEDFAKEKIISFYSPLRGNKFMMVTWGGMTGVLSGMNEQGLTVTLNAAKSDIQWGAATPVSLVAREILQYASNIDEAYAIAKKRKTFVAESFLIGSASDKKVAIIEKTPDEITLYYTNGDWIIDTNHFLSESLGGSELNQQHIKTSASLYRYNRVKELLVKEKLDVKRAVAILRDRNGLGDTSIGLGNERAINQLVAHHGIVFQPELRTVYVSTEPWQLGKFVAYNLTEIFSKKMINNEEIYEKDLTIKEDEFIHSQDYEKYIKYFQYRFPFQPHNELNSDSIVTWNPESYHAYLLAGDQEFKRKQYSKALRFYNSAVTKEVSTESERNYIEQQILNCQKILK